jgi:hypothetical protein
MTASRCILSCPSPGSNNQPPVLAITAAGPALPSNAIPRAIPNGTALLTGCGKLRRWAFQVVSKPPSREAAFSLPSAAFRCRPLRLLRMDPCEPAQPAQPACNQRATISQPGPVWCDETRPLLPGCGDIQRRSVAQSIPICPKCLCFSSIQLACSPLAALIATSPRR